jgi:hypothetical protein
VRSAATQPEGEMMEITYKSVSRFVVKFGRVTVLDTEGKTRVIEDDPESIDLVDKANRFNFQDIWYNREEFAKLMSEKLGEK